MIAVFHDAYVLCYTKMGWHTMPEQNDKPLPEPMILKPYDVTRSQWVYSLIYYNK